MNIASITQLCGLTSLLVQKNNEFSRALRDHVPKPELSQLKYELKDVYRRIKEVRTNIGDQ